MDRGSNRDYDRDYADPREVPPEPMGFWGLSARSAPWGRNEDTWGTSRRSGRRDWRAAPARDRRYWGWPGEGWGDGRAYGAYERPPEEYGRRRRDDLRLRRRGGEGGGRGGGGREERWRERHRGITRGEVDPSSFDEGTGAWGPGQAEPGLWGREPVSRRRNRQWYDRDLGEARRPSAGDEITWSGWGYEWTGRGRGGRGPADRDRQGRPVRTPSDAWGDYRRSSPGERQGAWGYGRQRRSMLHAPEEWGRGGRGRRSGGRPDLREGEAWSDVGPERWTRERRPEDREGLAKEWDRGYYFGREDKGGGTLPSVGRHKWTPGSGGPGPQGQEHVEDYGPPGRGPEPGAGKR